MLASALQHFPVRSKKGIKVCPMQMYRQGNSTESIVVYSRSGGGATVVEFS